MNNQETVARVINYLLALLFVAALLSAGIYFYTKQKTPEGSVSAPFSKNMRFASKLSDTEVRYYNGNSFIAVNPTSGKTQLLSQYQMIPGVTQIFWLESGVVFATTEVGTFSDLRPAMEQSLVNDPESRIGAVPTYWHLSFTNGKIKPISTNVVQPESFGVVASNGAFVFKDGSGGSYSILQKDGQILYGAINVEEDSRPVYATENSLIYAEQTSEISNQQDSKSTVALKRIDFFKEDGVTITDNLFKDGISNISSRIGVLDETHYLIDHVTNTKKIGGNDLYLYDTKTGKRKKVIKEFEGLIGQSGSGVYAIKQGRSFSTIHNVTKDGVVQRQRISADEHNTTVGALEYKDGFIVTFATGSARLVNKDKTVTTSVKAAYDGALEKEITNLPNGLSLDRNIESPYDTSYTLSFSGKSRDALNALRVAILEKGYDPNQFTIALAPGRNAEF